MSNFDPHAPTTRLSQPIPLPPGTPIQRPPPRRSPRKKSGCLGKLIAGLLFLLMLIVAFLGTYSAYLKYTEPQPTPTPTPVSAQPTVRPAATAVVVVPSSTPIPTVTIMAQVTLNGREKTEKTIYAQDHYTVWLSGTVTTFELGPFKNDKQKFLLSEGFCEAGIDFGRQPEQFIVQDNKVIVVLPQATLLNCGLTNNSYGDGSGWGSAPDELYNQLADEALRQMRQRAVESSLVQQAQEQAELRERIRVLDLLRKINRQDLEVEVQSPQNVPHNVPPTATKP